MSLNNALHMGLRTQLARYLHMRVAMNYRNAGIGSDYRLRLSTIKRDSQLLNRKRLGDNVKVVEDALDELVEAGVLHGYATERQMHGKRLADAVFTLRASMQLIDDTKAANRRAVESRETLRALDLLPK